MIEAAKNGYKATGIELNPWLVLYSQVLSLKYGMSKSHCHFKKGDLWKSNIGLYDAVIIFGVEEMVLRYDFLDSRVSAYFRRMIAICLVVVIGIADASIGEEVGQRA